MTKKKAYFILLISVASISLSPIITRYSTAPSLSISAFRLLFATLLTGIIGFTPLRIGLKTIKKESLFWIFISGIVLALHFWAWIESLSFTSIASSTLLVCTHPLIVLPLSFYLFKEPMTLKKIAGLALTLLGTFLLSGLTGVQSLSDGLYGNVLAVIGAVFVGLYLLIGKKIRPQVDNATYTFLVYGVATIFLFIAQFFSSIQVSQFTSQDYLVFILLAIFPTLLGHSLFNKVLEILSATTVSLATLGEPILASIYALFLFKELITPIQFLAGGLILIGIAVSEIPSKKNKSPKNSGQKKDEIFQSHKQNEGDLF